MPRRKPRHIKVPKPPPSAYNPDRPVSTLIANQVRHLRRVEGTLSPPQQTGVDIEGITTERQASRYIRKVTRLLHPAGAKTFRPRPKKAPPARKRLKARASVKRRTPASRKGQRKK